MAIFLRNNGIILHPTSLPSKHGIGELGGSVFDFIDFLTDSKVGLWQVLPLGPTGFGDSPYQSFSSFAGNPLLISIQDLKERGYVHQDDFSLADFGPSAPVPYGEVIQYKTTILERAFENFKKSRTYFTLFPKYVASERYWIEDYALFMAIKEKHGGIAWSEWDDEYKTPDPSKIVKWQKNFEEKLNYYKFLQYIFNLQWTEVKEYANKNGIKIIGDVPIFVAFDSADCWANQEFYFLDSKGNPDYVAGVPPDYFSETGQLWGNPLYDWNVLEKHEYEFWIRRIAKTLELVDLIRIDHFRGFEAYWKIPADEDTAINGEWEKGPGRLFFDVVKNKLGKLPLIAEDLGYITKEVKQLRNALDLPGMKILQYAFGKDEFSSNDYLPHNFANNCVVYTGTHDNDTTKGWYRSTDQETRQHFLEYANSNKKDPVGDMIRLAWSSVANFAIIPLQDLLRKDSKARMNHPGRPQGNWQWRFGLPEIDEKHKNELLRLNKLYHRYSQSID